MSEAVLTPAHEWFVEYVCFGGTTLYRLAQGIAGPTPEVAMDGAPEMAYAFRFYMMPAPPHPELPGYDVVPKRVDQGGTYYINATTFSREKIEDMQATEGWGHMMLHRYPDAKVYVQCQFGNWQVFEEHDRIWLDPQPNYTGTETESV